MMDGGLVNYGDYLAGHISLPIHINGCDNDSHSSGVQTYVEKNEKEVKVHQRDLFFRYESLKHETAINKSAFVNLRGLLAFRMGKFELAAHHFESVLDDDGEEGMENVNALQNLAHTYAQLNMKAKADEKNVMVRTLLGRSCGDQSSVSGSNRNINHRVAQSLGEHAIAHAYDVGMTCDEDRRERLEEALSLFDRALNLSASLLSVERRREWFNMMALILVRLDAILARNVELRTRRLNFFNRAINILKDLEKSSLVIIKSTSSALLGILLERQEDFRSTPISIHDCGYTGLHSLQCYSRAIEIADRDVHVLNKLSKIFQANGKHELAIATTNMSIESDGSDSNIVPLHTRAKVYTTMYMRDLAKNKSESFLMPDRELLEKAKTDLEIVVRVSPCLRTYVDIGQTCYYMGADAISEGLIVDETAINAALVYFSRALECEMGKSFPELQLLRGKCMKIRGEEDNALECFKQSALVERKGSSNTITFQYMMETYMNWFVQNEERADEAIDEVDEWSRLFIDNFDRAALKLNLRSLAHERTHDLLQLCEASIKRNKFALAKACFDIFSCQL